MINWLWKQKWFVWLMCKLPFQILWRIALLPYFIVIQIIDEGFFSPSDIKSSINHAKWDLERMKAKEND